MKSNTKTLVVFALIFSMLLVFGAGSRPVMAKSQTGVTAESADPPDTPEGDDPARDAERKQLFLECYGSTITNQDVQPWTSTPPDNDNLADAAVVSVLPFSTNLETFAATLEVGELDMYYCGENIGATVWYTYTPTEDGTMVIDTSYSNYDTVVHVFNYYGDLIDCDDDSGDGLASLLAVDLTAGVTYLISIGGYNSAGQLFVDIFSPEPFTNCAAVADVPSRSAKPWWLCTTAPQAHPGTIAIIGLRTTWCVPGKWFIAITTGLRRSYCIGTT